MLKRDRKVKWWNGSGASLFTLCESDGGLQDQSSKHKHLSFPSAHHQTHPPPSNIQGESTHSSFSISNFPLTLIFTFVLYELILCTLLAFRFQPVITQGGFWACMLFPAPACSIFIYLFTRLNSSFVCGWAASSELFVAFFKGTLKMGVTCW